MSAGFFCVNMLAVVTNRCLTIRKNPPIFGFKVVACTHARKGIWQSYYRAFQMLKELTGFGSIMLSR
ncbi:MAG: hypothetical protein AAFZ80_07195, partial [Cyanobacteria bacterium P01_A01_bin.105]